MSTFDLHAAVVGDHRDLIGSVSGMPAPIKPSRSSALGAREPMWIVGSLFAERYPVRNLVRSTMIRDHHP
jgi:hypothetical protein